MAKGIIILRGWMHMHMAVTIGDTNSTIPSLRLNCRLVLQIFECCVGNAYHCNALSCSCTASSFTVRLQQRAIGYMHVWCQTSDFAQPLCSGNQPWNSVLMHWQFTRVLVYATSKFKFKCFKCENSRSCVSTQHQDQLLCHALYAGWLTSLWAY